MNLTYITSYNNSTLECIDDIVNNVTISTCHGTISVIPYNQDLIVVFGLIQTICLTIIALLFIIQFGLARR